MSRGQIALPNGQFMGGGTEVVVVNPGGAFPAAAAIGMSKIGLQPGIDSYRHAAIAIAAQSPGLTPVECAKRAADLLEACQAEMAARAQAQKGEPQ